MNGCLRMDSLLLRFGLLIASLIYCTSGLLVRNITCSMTFQNFMGRRNLCLQPCMARCKGKCESYDNGKVYGTVRYSQRSSICSSAVHDLRISIWNDSLKTVNFKCHKSTKGIFLGESLRHRVQSDLKVNAKIYCEFSNPRISEEILDVISLHHNYMFRDNEAHMQECRIAEKHLRNIDFYAHTQKQLSLDVKGSYRYFYSTWKDNEGAFWCRPQDDMLSSILSLAMRRNASLHPERLTVTSSVNDTATIKMQSMRPYGKYLIWYKDGYQTGSTESLEKTFEHINVGDTGLYSVRDGVQGKKQGKFRLIVRVCAHGKYGPSCEHECPNCLSGGVCHDITGDCICPPGFNGSDCGNACGEGLFGKDCTQQCLNETYVPISCKEILFCLPDPYGCSCISGFHTLYCNQSCDAGKYGAGCTQTCSDHCNNVVGGTCDPYTGYCTSGCEEGWHGKSCFHSFPVLKKKPSITWISSNNFSIGFKKWKAETDIGIGQVKSYIVQYKKSDYDEDWTTAAELEAGNESYAISIKNLQPDTQYSARVIIIDESGSKQNNSVPEATAHTACGVPQSPPIDIFINASLSKTITVRWKLPDWTTWQCNNVTVSLSYEFDSNTTLIKGLSGNEYTFGIEPYTNFTVKLQTVTKNGLWSDWCNEIQNISAAEAPPAPSNVTIYNRSSSFLSLHWIPPNPPRGELEKYEVFYMLEKESSERQISGNESSWKQRTPDLKANEWNCKEREGLHCCELTGLDANKGYLIRVCAYNRNVHKRGECSIVVKGITMESIPGPPTEAEILNRTETSLGITWKEPSITNGILIQYRINITAIESYDSNAISLSHFQTTGPDTKYYIFDGLYPATTYNATIEARTKVGYGMPGVFVFQTKHTVPVIDFEPEVAYVTDTTVELKVTPVEFKGGPINGYYVVVRQSRRKQMREVEKIELISYSTSIENRTDYYIAAMFVPEEINSSVISFIVGDGRIYHEFYNPPLVTGNEYIFGIAVLSNYSGEELIGQKFLSRAVKVEHPSSYARATGRIIGIVFAIIAFFVIIVAVMACRNKNLRRSFWPHCVFKTKGAPDLDGSPTKVLMNSLNIAEEEKVRIDEGNRSIPISQLEEYVREGSQSGLLQQEFMSVEKRQYHSSDVAKLPENRTKNRYRNLLAYDHTRVILTKIPGDPYSDYINANYVDGYRKPKKYIATQGPKPTTVHDFWRMIWQENVSKIIMCSGLTEGGKIKCVKYWPDGEENYGPLRVSLTGTETFVNYVIRTFHATYIEERREIKHFHFTTWPDHEVPMYPMAVASFMQKVRTYQPNSNSPVVIHCSAGVGRTGTLILIDAMLDMAIAVKSVELTSHLHIMRNQRINMVETLNQYCFVYQVLIEALCRENTAILCADYFYVIQIMEEVDTETGETKFSEQFQRLAKICPPLNTSATREGLDPTNQSKNRITNVVPPDHARPILRAPRNNPNSTYINAVFVNGYRKKDAFIITQMPLPETMGDFWNMMYHFETNTIVLLNSLEPNDETLPQYWPDISENFYDIEVSNVQSDSFSYLATRTFELRKQEDKRPKIIKQFHLDDWHRSSFLPASAEMILHVIGKVERWQQQFGNGSIVVQCFDGVRACGLYCAATFICDKMKAEQEVDVFLAIKSIRENRPQFIENEEQYIYCHLIASAYLDSFETYANFQ